ncbi:MAG: hypothetical protein AB1777_01860 [Bacteroidota bacterium]
MDTYFFPSYSKLEVKIFKGIKSYFEKQPPFASSDYENGFYDVVAQYEAGGQHYTFMAEYYKELIASVAVDIFNSMPADEQLEIRRFYEINFLEQYYDSDSETYEYTINNLALNFSNRFSSWVEDHFTLEDLFNGTENNDGDDEID